MATQLQVVIDCAEPARLAEFWANALHYKVQEPPNGFASWPAFHQAQGMPEEEWGNAAVVDPSGVGPRIYFQYVPESKTVKNRVHLDLNVGQRVSDASPAQLLAQIDLEVARLKSLGARELYRMDQPDDMWVTMADPEDNEFCVQ